MKRLLPIIFILTVVLIFFWQLIFKGFLPIPSDTIVGLYYPFREAYFKTNPFGVPFKNFLLTDSVRQQYPWKNLSIQALKNGTMPLWNPYNFAGTPLLANFQSAAFYPLNIIFFILPFSIAWSLLILLQPLLSSLFLYLYLNNLRLNKKASFLGAITFAFSGFSIAWMEWGTILNTALWLPLMLLSIDKIILGFNKRLSIANFPFGLPQGRQLLIWSFIFVFSLTSAFLAGHLQIFLYIFVLSLAYLSVRLLQQGRSIKTVILFASYYLLFIILTLPQWLSTLQFILLSARNLDIVGLNLPGWFIPWQNLIQFVAPDFFGNPATLNYWGIWNYGEFIGYVGMFPLLIAFFALFFRRDKNTLFFGTVFFVSLIFALPTWFAKIPFDLKLPLISTSQPTRLLILADFALSVLAALGLDYFLSLKNKRSMLHLLVLFSLLFLGLIVFVFTYHGKLITPENLHIIKSNLALPIILFIATVSILIVLIFYPNINKFKKQILNSLVYLLMIIAIFDLFRFGWKFEPFTNKSYLYPPTSVTNFLLKHTGNFRIIATDSRIFPPNFSIMYKLQTLDGYDPLYLQRYGELMVALKRNSPKINPPFGFNRIITPQNPRSKIIDLLGVKYVLSFEKINDPKLKMVFTDNVIQIYENTAVLPRAFFVNQTLLANSKQQSITMLFAKNILLNKTAIVEDVKQSKLFDSNWSSGEISIARYGENNISLESNNSGKGFLVLTDSYYPNWHAAIDGKETKIYLTDYNFRGIIVPEGKHKIEFYNTLF